MKNKNCSQCRNIIYETEIKKEICGRVGSQKYARLFCLHCYLKHLENVKENESIFKYTNIFIKSLEKEIEKVKQKLETEEFKRCEVLRELENGN